MLTSSWKEHFKAYGTFYLSGLIVVGLALAYLAIPSFQDFILRFWEVVWSKDKEESARFFENYALIGSILLILLMVLQMFLIVFPTWLPMIIAVLGYGPVWGFIISVIAVFTASTVGYFVGGAFTGGVKNHIIGKKRFNQLSNLMQDYGFWLVVLFRISPILSNDAISFVAGIMKMGYRRYIGATILGIIPLAGAIAYVGQDIDTLKKGFYWIGVGGIIIYGLYMYLKYRNRKRKDRKQEKT